MNESRWAWPDLGFSKSAASTVADNPKPSVIEAHLLYDAVNPFNYYGLSKEEIAEIDSNIEKLFAPLERPKSFMQNEVIQRLKLFLNERGLGQDYQISSAIADFEEMLAVEDKKADQKTNKTFPSGMSELKTVSGEIVSNSSASNHLPEKNFDLYKKRVDNSENAPKWGKRDKQKYKGYPSIFQFIIDYHPDVRTTGGLYERDHSLYQSYRTAMERRQELIAGGEKPESFPEGFKPLLDRDTDIATRERPTPEQRKHARKILLREEQARKREKTASR